MDFVQLSNMLKPLIQQARNEDKFFFHKKVLDENGKPIFITPDDLESALYRGEYPYYPEEWELVDPLGLPPWYYRLIADEGKENELAIIH